MKPVKEWKEKVRRRPSGYKLFLRECIKELKERFPDGSIALPMLSRMCSENWAVLDPNIKIVFQQEADYEAHSAKRFEAKKMPVLKPMPVMQGFSGMATPSPMKLPAQLQIATPLKSVEVQSYKIQREGPRTPQMQVANWMTPNEIRDREMEKSLLKLKRLKKKEKKLRWSQSGGPKRPLSSFVYFCKEERAKVRVSHPDKNMGEVSQILSKIWSAMDADQKAKYVKISREDRKRYSQELAVFKKKMQGISNDNMEIVDVRDFHEESAGRVADFAEVSINEGMEDGDGGLAKQDENMYEFSLENVKQEPDYEQNMYEFSREEPSDEQNLYEFSREEPSDEENMHEFSLDQVKKEPEDEENLYDFSVEEVNKEPREEERNLYAFDWTEFPPFNINKTSFKPWP